MKKNVLFSIVSFLFIFLFISCSSDIERLAKKSVNQRINEIVEEKKESLNLRSLEILNSYSIFKTDSICILRGELGAIEKGNQRMTFDYEYVYNHKRKLEKNIVYDYMTLDIVNESMYDSGVEFLNYLYKDKDKNTKEYKEKMSNFIDMRMAVKEVEFYLKLKDQYDL